MTCVPTNPHTRNVQQENLTGQTSCAANRERSKECVKYQFARGVKCQAGLAAGVTQLVVTG